MLSVAKSDSGIEVLMCFPPLRTATLALYSSRYVPLCFGYVLFLSFYSLVAKNGIPIWNLPIKISSVSRLLLDFELTHLLF